MEHGTLVRLSEKVFLVAETGLEYVVTQDGINIVKEGKLVNRVVESERDGLYGWLCYNAIPAHKFTHRITA